MRWALVLTAVGALGCVGPSVPRPPVAEPDGVGLRFALDPSREEVIVDMGPFHVPAIPAMAGSRETIVTPGMHPATEIHSAPGTTGMSVMRTQGHGPESAHDVDGARTPLMVFAWPVDGWLRGFRVRVVDEEGNELPRDLLHHMIGVNFGRWQFTYPALERFIGIGAETRDVELPRSLGIPIAKGQELGVYAAWHNDTGRALHGVHVRIALKYTPRSRASPVTAVLPAYCDTNNTIGGSNAWDVPPGRSERSWEFTVPVSGGPLAVTGHLHDYGEQVRLEDAETGAVLVRLEARRDSAGRLEEVPTRILRK